MQRSTRHKLWLEWFKTNLMLRRLHKMIEIRVIIWWIFKNHPPEDILPVIKLAPKTKEPLCLPSRITGLVWFQRAWYLPKSRSMSTFTIAHRFYPSKTWGKLKKDWGNSGEGVSRILMNATCRTKKARLGSEKYWKYVTLAVSWTLREPSVD